jgi:NTP pyrophosphatase (non-canonical NTP hydrolase)
MARQAAEFDFARSIRDIESLKVGMLTAVSEVYELMQDGYAGGEALGEALAGVVSSAVFLGEKLGISFDEMDRRVARKMENGRIARG